MAWHALEHAVAAIEKKFGKAEVPWGQINVVARGGEFPMDGTSVEMFGVLHPDAGPEDENGKIHSNDGWGHLMIVMESDPLKPAKSWTIRNRSGVTRTGLAG